MKTADAIQQALAVLGKMDKVMTSDNLFKRYQKRDGGCGGLNYGHTYFNPVQIEYRAPELQLTASAVRGQVRFENDLFSVWVLEYTKLRDLCREPVSYCVGWDLYSYSFIGKGVVMVFPSNRFRFGKALAAVAGTNDVFSCSVVR